MISSFITKLEVKKIPGVRKLSGLKSLILKGKRIALVQIGRMVRVLTGEGEGLTLSCTQWCQRERSGNMDVFGRAKFATPSYMTSAASWCVTSHARPVLSSIHRQMRKLAFVWGYVRSEGEDGGDEALARSLVDDQADMELCDAKAQLVLANCAAAVMQWSLHLKRHVVVALQVEDLDHFQNLLYGPQFGRKHHIVKLRSSFSSICSMV